MPEIKLITSYDSGCVYVDSINIVYDETYTFIYANVLPLEDCRVLFRALLHIVNGCDADVDVSYYYEYYEFDNIDNLFHLQGTTGLVYHTLTPGDNYITDADSSWGPWGASEYGGSNYIDAIVYMTFPDLTTKVVGFEGDIYAGVCDPDPSCFTTDNCG